METFFEFVFEVKDITKDAQKQTLLLHYAGQDVQDVFVRLSGPGPAPDEETQYAQAMRLLDAHFYHKLTIHLHDISFVKQTEGVRDSRPVCDQIVPA